MSGPIGRIAGSLATFHNENSISLATMNFDFTLVKLDAPPEYAGLGATISRNRKVAAEEGALHKTARKLGALFDGILPRTQELFRAYGKRVSEISSMPSVNPRSAEREGIFAGHTGADTASIWAAATSGHSAIAVHLLACMLARIFTSSEATSLWVELVEKQKQHIIREQQQDLYSESPNAAFLAAQQDISRVDLANWDASARAWLQSADQAKMHQHKQAMLILNNASVPVNGEAETYTSVVKAWKEALEAMNCLVKGMPQRIHDGAALLALSSWHLYPDMVVFGGSCVEIKQKDPLFDSSAMLTLGLQHVRHDTKSVYWSLPLSRLQYYGHPVKASRTAGHENSRVTCEEFAYIILGCVFKGWRDFAATDQAGINWLMKLAAICELSSPHHSRELSWLSYLVTATQRLLDCEDAEKKVAHQLLNLGRRRATFLQLSNDLPSPLFGLSQLVVFLDVLKGNEQRVFFLRQYILHSKQNGAQFLISYHTENRREFATVIPVVRASLKRMADGERKVDKILPSNHIRWVILSTREVESIIRYRKWFEKPEKCLEKLEQLRDRYTQQARLQESPLDGKLQELRQDYIDFNTVNSLTRRRQFIEGLGEMYLPLFLVDGDIPHRISFCLGNNFIEASQHFLQQLHGGPENPLLPTFYAGDPGIAALYSMTDPAIPAVPNPVLDPKDFEDLEGFFVAKNFDSQKIHSLFSGSQYLIVHNQVNCLRACVTIAEIYKLLPGATISTLVLTRSLTSAKWMPQFIRIPPYISLTLSQTFACIAMFESGICDLDPNSLTEAFAMSSGNSLYVAGALLCDPFECPLPTEIRRVVGNIGRAGITLLISPPEVKIRDPDPQNWRAINHNEFDGRHEDYFQKTSIHLSFTEYDMSLQTEDNPRHIIDRTAALVESLVSVYDGGAWVGEVDILKALTQKVYRCTCKELQIEEQKADHRRGHIGYQEAKSERPNLAATSIETWDELIEAPSTGAIAIRAHKNWLARLATTAVCVRFNFAPLVLPEDACWTCCAAMIPEESRERFAFVC